MIFFMLYSVKGRKYLPFNFHGKTIFPMYFMAAQKFCEIVENYCELKQESFL